ncbi:tryptase-like [Dromiciops gliroides]|uniref:tryptase-like n=1 Tax=Dromiciops gliroides TaxID=33562 RepID=UPI001CC4246D|nr:tryptase-like [Dromiciops gliroides]
MELFLLFLTLPLLGTSVPMPQGLRGLLPPPYLSQRERAGIVGGEEARKKDWPWQVSLREQENMEGEVFWTHICGGSLIQSEWILTAASCFSSVEEEPSSYRVQLREQHLYYEDKLLSPSKIVVHSNFTFENEGANIALLKLKEPVHFSSQVQPIKLPAPSQNFSNSECWVTGWGNTNIRDELPPPFTLRQVQVPVLDHRDCDQLYHKGSTTDGSVRIILEDMLCAGIEDQDICKGDYGSALACKVEDSWIQAGVASSSETCGFHPNRPGIYTEVSKYLDWIQEIIH